jgi:AmiR/NasT family two-component response regulator
LTHPFTSTLADVTAYPVDNELRVALRRLMSVTRSSFEQRAHLERALESRIVIEQAKGILAERLRLDLDDAYVLIRRTARSSRRRAHEIAAEVVEQRETPAAVLAALHDLLRERS